METITKTASKVSTRTKIAITAVAVIAAGGIAAAGGALFGPKYPDLTIPKPIEFSAKPGTGISATITIKNIGANNVPGTLSANVSSPVNVNNNFDLTLYFADSANRQVKISPYDIVFDQTANNNFVLSKANIGQLNFTVSSGLNVNAEKKLTIGLGSAWLNAKKITSIKAVVDSNNRFRETNETNNTITSIIPTLPGAPTNLKATLTPTPENPNAVVLSWTAPQNTGGLGVPLVDYDIAYWTILTSGNPQGIFSPHNTNTSFTDNNVKTAGSSYKYQVRANNVAGTGAYSNAVTITIPTVPLKVSLNTASPSKGIVGKYNEIQRITLTASDKDINVNSLTLALSGTCGTSTNLNVYIIDPANFASFDKRLLANGEFVSNISGTLDMGFAQRLTVPKGTTKVISVYVTGKNLVCEKTDGMIKSTINSVNASAAGVSQTVSGLPLSGNSVLIYGVTVAKAPVTDTTAPDVLKFTPTGENVSVGMNFSAFFSEPVTASTINNTTFRLRTSTAANQYNGELIAGTISYDSTANAATFDPTNDLAPGTGYILVVGEDVKDLVGNTMGHFSYGPFTTAPAPIAVAPAIASLAVGLNAAAPSGLVVASTSTEIARLNLTASKNDVVDISSISLSVGSTCSFSKATLKVVSADLTIGYGYGEINSTTSPVEINFKIADLGIAANTTKVIKIVLDTTKCINTSGAPEATLSSKINSITTDTTTVTGLPLNNKDLVIGGTESAAPATTAALKVSLNASSPSGLKVNSLDMEVIRLNLTANTSNSVDVDINKLVFEISGSCNLSNAYTSLKSSDGAVTYGNSTANSASNQSIPVSNLVIAAGSTKVVKLTVDTHTCGTPETLQVKIQNLYPDTLTVTGLPLDGNAIQF